MWAMSKTRTSMEFNNTLKIGTVIGVLFMLIANSYIITTIPGPTSYEVSIYNAFPRILWVNFILIDVLALFWVLFDSKNGHRAIMIGILFLNQLTILLLPLFRGYFIYGRFDVLEHLGRVKDILLTGNIGSGNFYPIMHILIAEIRTVAGVSLNSQTVWLPAFFWSILLMGYFVFVSNFTSDTNLGKLSSLIWVFFPLGYWHSSMVGNMFSFEFMFLILGVWFSSIARAKKYLLTTIMYTMLVFFHPLTSMYLLMIFATLDLTTYYMSNAKSGRDYFTRGLGTIVAIVWVVWYLSFERTKYPLRKFLFSLVGLIERKNSAFLMYISNVEKYNIPLLRIAKFSLYRYWGVVLVGGLALVTIVELLSFIRTKRKDKIDLKIVIFVLFVFLFATWSMVNIFVKIVNFERSLRYVIAFSVPLASMRIHRVEKFEVSRKKVIGLVVIILLFSYFGSFTIHRSPLSGQLNFQVTAGEYYGMGWWFDRREDSLIGYDDGKITQYRFYKAWYGAESALRAKNLLHFARGRSLIPEHFGYNKGKLAGEFFRNPVYFILGRAVFEFYNVTIWDRTDYWRWHPQEVFRLRHDETANIIYSSSDIDIYLIIPPLDRTIKGDLNEN